MQGCPVGGGGARHDSGWWLCIALGQRNRLQRFLGRYPLSIPRQIPSKHSWADILNRHPQTISGLFEEETLHGFSNTIPLAPRVPSPLIMLTGL
jgi:hypothetical protein